MMKKADMQSGFIRHYRPPLKSEISNLRFPFAPLSYSAPRAARHNNDANGVAELSPG